MSVYDGAPEPITYHRGAIFTVELGSLVENGFDLGMKDYPIYDENYREPLNNKIIEHFWFREIGLETPQLFRRFLNRRMNEIMPYYNQLYKSALLEFDPLSNYNMQTEGTTKAQADNKRDYKRTERSTSNASTETDNTTDSTARNLVSQTPQMQLSGHDDYASNITDSVSNSKVVGTTSQDTVADSTADDRTSELFKNTEQYVTRVSGLSGVLAADALDRYRNTLINIDMMIISDLNNLFMGIYTDYFNAL